MQAYFYSQPNNVQRHYFLFYAIQIMIKKALTSQNYRDRDTNHNSARAGIKLERINKTIITHKNKPDNSYNSITTLGYNYDKVQKKISLNDEILHRRKQNFLNTQYNKRLNNLKIITKQNKKIYERINSQKSLYSQQSMKKSQVSVRSLSRSSSRVSHQSKKSQKNGQNKQKGLSKPQKSGTMLTIQPERLNNIKQQNMSQFKSMFLRQKFVKPVPKTNVPVFKRENQVRSFSLHEQIKPSKEQMGNMLHKIAEQMYQPPKKNYQNFMNKRRPQY